MSWHKITEQQNPNSAQIDGKSTKEILDIINYEDAGVAAAIHKKINQINNFIETLIPRMQSGGRLFYIGSGTFCIYEIVYKFLLAFYLSF